LEESREPCTALKIASATCDEMLVEILYRRQINGKIFGRCDLTYDSQTYSMAVLISYLTVGTSMITHITAEQKKLLFCAPLIFYNVFRLPTITPPTPVRASPARWVEVRVHVLLLDMQKAFYYVMILR
jgi:hypothetical protein